jgi:hypothetical protein
MGAASCGGLGQAGDGVLGGGVGDGVETCNSQETSI